MEELTFKKVLTIVVIIFVMIIGLGVLFGSAFTVSPGERAFITSFGKPQSEILTEGLHFKKPFIDSVIKMDIKVQKVESPDLLSASKDLQNVTTHVAINYEITPADIIKVYSQVGDLETVGQKLINPAVSEVVKAITAKYTAVDLVNERSKVSNDLMDGLKEKLKKYGIIISDVNIINFKYSDQFENAIEAKVTAEQTALAEKNKLETIKYQAQQTIETANGDAQSKLIKAKAEAEAIKIQSQAIVQQGGEDYVKLKAIEKWNGELPKIISGNGGSILNIPSETITK